MPIIIIKKIASYFIDNPEYLIIIVLLITSFTYYNLNNSKLKEIANLTTINNRLEQSISESKIAIETQNASIVKYKENLVELNTKLEKSKIEKDKIDKVTYSKLNYTAPKDENANFIWLVDRALEITKWKK